MYPSLEASSVLLNSAPIVDCIALLDSATLVTAFAYFPAVPKERSDVLGLPGGTKASWQRRVLISKPLGSAGRAGREYLAARDWLDYEGVVTRSLAL